MKKILYHTLSLLFASFIFASCENDSLQSAIEQAEGVTLTLRLSSNDLQSRAEKGEDAYNENAIKKVDLYLYSTRTGQALYKLTQTFTDKKDKAELTASLSNDLVTSLFGSGTTCHAYALVNYVGKDAPLANTDDSKIANLKALEITPNFSVDGVSTFATILPQPSFVMDGESSLITYNSGTRKVTGTINVNRAASKISLYVTSVDKTITDDAGNTWKPDFLQMYVSFHNGVNKAKVDEGYNNGNRPNNTFAVDGNIYETTGDRKITAICTNPDNTTATTYALATTHVPFYSYSYDWANSTNDEMKPSITLMVPWMKIKNADGTTITDAQWQTCYYQIPVNVESKNGSLANCFERNMYYQIKLHVGILGDFDPTTPTPITTASYYTVDWQNQDVDVDIKNYKYLVVDKNDVTVYNENEVRIGYASSNPINAEITYIRRPDYSSQVVDTTSFYGTLGSTSGSSSVAQGTNSLLRACTVTVENNEIVLNHNIVNQSTTSGSNYDFVPYYIWVKVTMTVKVNGVDETFTEWIRYEQYPEIYIEAKTNSAYKEGYSDSQANNDRNVYVNSYWSQSAGGGYGGTSYTHNACFTDNGTPGTDYDTFGPAVGLSYSLYYNNNPNMYVIHVTSISDDEYIIGDPREKQIDSDFIGNTNNTVWATAPAIDNSRRKLQYYYSTDSSDGTMNMIAPVFRIASSYSGTDLSVSSYSNDGYEVAKRRCASYQEDGYPAGRWRMPTFAEARFICTLSYEGKIPALFATQNNVSYYCAHGPFRALSNGSVNLVDSDPVSVRCVYDEWYWGSEKIESKKTFTWGDAERQ